MNFSHSLVVRDGPRAGQPRFANTAATLAHLAAAHEIADKLAKNGFLIVNATADGAHPVIQVRPCGLTRELIDANQAIYFRYRHGERHGQFWAEAADGTRVRVTWIERIEPCAA